LAFDFSHKRGERQWGTAQGCQSLELSASPLSSRQHNPSFALATFGSPASAVSQRHTAQKLRNTRFRLVSLSSLDLWLLISHTERSDAMADSDGEFVADDMSDDDLMDHNVSDDNREAGGATSYKGGGGRDGGAGGGASRSRRRRKGERNQAQAWEQSKRTWETNLPEEDQDGVLNLTALEAEKRRRLLRDTTPLQRGIIRHLVLVLDMSFAMAEKDLLPTRYRLTLGYAVAFVREFFEQNPISQLGIVGMRDGVAVRISDLGGNPAEHIEKLKSLEDEDPQGNPSLQNALEMCRGALL
jgi:transcription initiation factor TFIIH subunit 2